MAKESIPQLETLLNRAAEGLPKLSSKKMFGCHALKVNETIFAMVWKEGRINLKLPDNAAYTEMSEAPGSQAWSPGGKKMGQWILVPVGLHTSPKDLKKWVHRAHQLCLQLPKKPKKKKA